MVYQPPRLVFAGTPEIAAMVLQTLCDHYPALVGVYSQPDKPVGRGQKLTASPVKQLAEQYHIPVYQPMNFKDPSAVAELAALQPDLMIVVAYGLLLPASILTIPRLGCLNIHTSLLPRWRGAAPIARALLAGDKQTGVTLMQMDEGLDTGAILAQTPYIIQPAETTASLTLALAQQGAKLLIETLPAIFNQQITKTPQSSQCVTYAHKLQKADGLLNWQLSADELACQIRALNPWPVAFTYLQQEAIRIWQAHALPMASDKAAGTIVNVSKAGCDVACGTQLLRLEKLQFPGGKILSIAEILNKNKCPLSPGIVFKDVPS